MRSTSGRRRRRRRWLFGTALFDEANWSLVIDGDPVPIESKPLELLHELCLRHGEVVSKDELLDTVWDGAHVVENSIPTAIAKLRRALGPANGGAIATVARIGYRLDGPVSIETLSGVTAHRFAFAAGDAVPGRPQWHLLASLGEGDAEDVWRGRHEKTGEIRIFKFADAPDRLRDLKREATLARLLLKALGPDGPFVQLLEWNFTNAPYFLESRDGGLSLVDWANAAGGLGEIAIDQRIGLAAKCARALAGIHGVGVLHKDIKPANILIDNAGGDLRVRLADFGSGRIIDDTALAAYAITDNIGDPPAASGVELLSGMPFYRAPELAAGAVPTVQSDVYSLGLVLFQLAVGDFTRLPAPGWARDITDPLLRDDIAAAAAGDPAMRIETASELADRLENLSQRRAIAAEQAATQARIDQLARLEGRRRARRPWIWTASAAALIGLMGTSAAALFAVNQRNTAVHQARIARASYNFLANDLLARSSPYRSGRADETVATAAKRASGEIDRRFAAAPLIAGRLHHSLAFAFDQRSDVPAARAEYAKADHDFARAGPAAVRERRILQAQWAQLEALSGDAARLPFARRLLAGAKSTSPQDGELSVWFASAAGSIALAGEDMTAAQAAYQRASALAERLPASFDERQRLNLRQRVAFTYLRLGAGVAAMRLLTPLLADFTRVEGADHPDTLNIRLNTIQALLVQKRFAAVVTAASALLPTMERALGRDHRRTLQVLAVRQQALGSLERYTEAARDGERVWRTTAAHEGSNAFQAIAGRADTGETQCRAGEYDKGLANARAALAAAEAPAGPETALAMALRTTVAGCLIESGRPLEAAPLLANIDRTKVSQLVGDATWGANLDLALAEVMFAQHAPETARAHLTAAIMMLADAADAHQRRQIERLSQTLK